MIADVSDSGNPFVVGSLGLPDSVLGVAANGALALVSALGSGLQVGHAQLVFTVPKLLRPYYLHRLIFGSHPNW